MNQITLYIFIFGVSIGLFILAVAFIQLRREKKSDAAPQNSVEPPAIPQASVNARPDFSIPPPPATQPTPAAVSPSTLSPLPPPVTIPEPIRPPAPTFAPHSGPVEVARLIHAPDGTLILEANGNWYTNRRDVADPKVLAVLAELERFLNSNELSTAAPSPVFQPASIPDPKAPPKPTTMVDGKPTIVMTAAEAAQLPLAKPSMDIFRQMKTLRERENQPQIKIKSVLEEIDEILQTKLEGTPLAYRGLKVSSDATGAALFVVDGQAYASVDQIPDAEARATIQAAIKEWERK